MRAEWTARRAPGVRVKAFAKINLTLRVLGLRADGYHDLRTTFQSLALHDTLSFTRVRGPFRIECDDPACPVDRTNLVWRAAEQVWRAARRCGEPEGVSARIEKRIPLEAGLGGGSSDAAAALRALTALWRLKIGDDRLRAIAAELGADVTFFLCGGTALGVDRGDVLFPLIDAPASWVVLVLPDFGVRTADAYRWLDTSRAENQHLRLGRTGLRPSAPFGEPGNDLQAPVDERHPEIGRLVAALGRAGAAYAAMSGSGSGVFGLFADEKTAESAAGRLKDRTRRALVTRTLTRADYRRLARPIRRSSTGTSLRSL